MTCVHVPSLPDHLECLKWLTKHAKYVPNEQTVHGATAVYFAAQEGRYVASFAASLLHLHIDLDGFQMGVVHYVIRLPEGQVLDWQFN